MLKGQFPAKNYRSKFSIEYIPTKSLLYINYKHCILAVLLIHHIFYRYIYRYIYRRRRQDTCKVETGLWFLTIFMNPTFYLHYKVWISMAPLFGQMEGCDSTYAMLSQHCSAYPSTTTSDRRKIRGSLASLLFLNLYNLYPSHMILHLPEIAVLIGFFLILYFFLILNNSG